MGVNRDKPDLWKEDIARSVDLYNAWFLEFAPKAFRETRIRTAKQVSAALEATEHLACLDPARLAQHPQVLPMLRMATCPPLARDRLIGLAGVSRNLVDCMEDPSQPRLPLRMPAAKREAELARIGEVIRRLADPDIFVWLGRSEPATAAEIQRASTIVADRLCGSYADPIIRNAQERRQLAEIAAWLDLHGYCPVTPGSGTRFDSMSPGTYSFRMNVPVHLVNELGEKTPVNIPVDAVVMPLGARPGDMPLLIEAKSAGDFTNVNKRRKEEAVKMQQLRATYGAAKVRFILFLCGYFDSGYLGYEACEGIDWVWEHRIDDLELFDL